MYHMAHRSTYNTFFMDLPGPSFVSHSSLFTTKGVDFAVGKWWLHESSVIFINLDLVIRNKYSLPSNVEPVESLLRTSPVLVLVAQWINFCLMHTFIMLGQCCWLYKSIYLYLSSHDTIPISDSTIIVIHNISCGDTTQ